MNSINLFLDNVYILYPPLKTPETFSGVYRGYKMGTLSTNELTFPVLVSGEEKNFKLNFYFLTSLWCLKRFFEGLKGNAQYEKG